MIAANKNKLMKPIVSAGTNLSLLRRVEVFDITGTSSPIWHAFTCIKFSLRGEGRDNTDIGVIFQFYLPAGTGSLVCCVISLYFNTI